MLVEVGLCSISSRTQATKPCCLQEPLPQFLPLFLYEVPLASVRLKYKWFVQPSVWHPLPCHICFRTVGEIALLFIWMSSNIQLRIDLDATCCNMLLLSPCSFAMFF